MEPPPPTDHTQPTKGNTMSNIARFIAGGVVGIAIVFGILAVTFAVAHISDPFAQDSFPCQEDEVLGYAPQFGPDNTGCIHIDTLKGTDR